jgi:hypothetical protein
VRSSEETSVDIRYRGEAGRRVSGTVKNVGAQGASIYLSSPGTGFSPSHSTFVLQDGRGFALYGVPDGDYEIIAQQTVSTTPGLLGDLMLSEPRQISVRGADISGLELTVQSMASVSGTITLEPSKATECQNKRRPTFAETVVDAVRNTKADNKSKLPAFSAYASSSQLNQEGTFTIRNLRDAQYALVPKFFARYWYVQSMSVASQSKAPAPRGTSAVQQKNDAARNWLSLKLGDRLTGLTITLAEGAASIRGKVPVAEGARPDENFKVFVVPAERDKADDVLRFSASTLSADGTFALNNLAPGRYLIVAQVNVDPELAPEKIKLPNAAESRAKLRRAAEAGKVEVELKPCQNLTDYKLTTVTQ